MALPVVSILSASLISILASLSAFSGVTSLLELSSILNSGIEFRSNNGKSIEWVKIREYKMIYTLDLFNAAHLKISKLLLIQVDINFHIEFYNRVADKQKFSRDCKTKN